MVGAARLPPSVFLGDNVGRLTQDAPVIMLAFFRNSLGYPAAPASTVAKRVAWAGLLALLSAQTTNVWAQQKRTTDGTEPKWEVLERCRLVTNSVVDGDSFHVLHEKREYIFRLYFVDAPEANAEFKDTVRNQAAHFGIAPGDVPSAGRLAAHFTRDLLSDQELTVITRWQNALGRSRLARFYAIVFVSGKNLAEELVANGHARIHGLRANWPDGPGSSLFISQLKNRELGAREKKLGVWDDTKFPRATTSRKESPKQTKKVPPAKPVDLNSATYEDLLTLPGVGEKTAQRIIANRPYAKVEDLDKVKGIGRAKLKQLTPLVRVTSPTP